MEITPGTKLAHYEISGHLGKGGMGEVWRASDTKLGRDVAIKVLPDEFTKDDERVARFDREARLLASLSHSHIASIHGIEDVDGVKFLVMELADGEDLSDRLARGPVPMDDAIEIAVQIADALEAAHEKGIVHRDLKPANIKVTDDGQVQVLDFGLAKALETEEGDDDFSNSPTMVRAATHHGVILGTAAYMSPEQARGKSVDKRADIWAFGVVVWEMLTGKRLFAGETVSDTLASVLKEQPDLDALPPDTPPAVRRVLERCLVKNPKNRLHDIGDARIDLEGRESESAALPDRPVTSTSRLPWIVAAVASIVAIGALWMSSRQPGSVLSPGVETKAPMRLAILPTPAEQLTAQTSLVISPDGSNLAFAAESEVGAQIYVRSMNAFEAKVLPGTESASDLAFSPDGEWIAFHAGSKLKKVAVSGAAPVSICDAVNSTGVSWGDKGTIVFNGLWGEGLKRVAATGGEPEVLTVPDREAQEGTHINPVVLPGEQWALFTIWSAVDDGSSSVGAVSLDTGDRHIVLESGNTPRYVSGGRLLFTHENAIMAVPFDLASATTKGQPVAVLDGVFFREGSQRGVFDVSSNGTLVFLPSARQKERYPLWVDLEGNVARASEYGGAFRTPRLSPDGRKVALEEEGAVFRLWIVDLDGGSRTRLFPASDLGGPMWLPDGKSILFWSNRNGPYQIFKTPIDGSSPPEVAVKLDTGYPIPTSISGDGKHVLFYTGDGDDIWVGDLENGEAKQFLATRSRETGAVFSPDDRWVAYQSNESGRNEIYVTPFPGPGPRWQVSREGGEWPLWAPDGGTVYYHDGSDMMAVRVTVSPSFNASSPTLLFSADFSSLGDSNFDISPDGTRFVMIEAQDRSHLRRLHVVLNWFEELESVVPAAN